MKKILILVFAGMLTTCMTGCLSRRYYYEPTTTTISTGTDGLKRGAVKEEGNYPFWSEAPGKSFLNPTVSLVGKSVKNQEE